jgi:hypothetical protein
MSQQAKRSRAVPGTPEQTQAIPPAPSSARRRSQEPLSDADQFERRQQLYRLKLKELEEQLSRLRSEVEGS